MALSISDADVSVTLGDIMSFRTASDVRSVDDSALESAATEELLGVSSLFDDCVTG